MCFLLFQALAVEEEELERHRVKGSLLVAVFKMHEVHTCLYAQAKNWEGGRG